MNGDVHRAQLDDAAATALDDRGGVMLLGLFMAVFLVAIVYYIAGIGEAVLHREGMQDAADAAALSAAVLHARGMNFIVLINLVMAALVAILLIFNVVLTLIRIAIVALTIASFFTLGSTAGLATALGEVQQSLSETYDTIEPTVMTSLSELHQVSSVVRKVVPQAAQLLAIEEVSQHHRNPAKYGFIVPSRVTLPVESDEYSVLCAHAARNVSGFLTEPLPKAAQKLVKDAAADVAAATSKWLCGAGDSPPPTYERKGTRSYPSFPEYQECVDQAAAATPNDEDEIERCESLRQVQAAGAPDEFGDCPKTSDCTKDGPYERLVAEARTQCNPAQKSKLKGYMWQQKTITERLAWNGDRWVSDEKTVGQGRVLPEALSDDAVGRDTPPCGTNAAAIGEGWNEAVHPKDEAETVLPLCSEDYSEQLPLNPVLGEVVTVKYETVTELLSCKEDIDVSVAIGAPGAKPIGGDGEGKEPYRIEAKLQLGSDDFQARSIAVGSEPSSLSERVMAIATWNRCPDLECVNTPIGSAELAKFSMAQAEYYYDHAGSEPRAEWMWNMKWRARLVRLRAPARDSEHSNGSDADMPAKPPAMTPAAACQLVAGAADCSRISQIWNQLSTLILH